MEKSRVLVVDDEVDVAKEIEMVIKEGTDCEVEVANSGDDALNRIKNKHFDVILLDIKMPKMLGTDVLKEIRKIGSDTEVIMVTALDEPKLVWQACKTGACDYITKPFDNEDLVLRVKMSIERRKSKDETSKKFSIFREVYLKGQETGGIYAKRRDLLNQVIWEKGGSLENVDIKDLEKIASGEWDSVKVKDLESQARS